MRAIAGAENLKRHWHAQFMTRSSESLRICLPPRVIKICGQQITAIVSGKWIPCRSHPFGISSNLAQTFVNATVSVDSPGTTAKSRFNGLAVKRPNE
jgi:hypothetical protein